MNSVRGLQARFSTAGIGRLPLQVDGLFYILSEDNVVGLAEATPKGYQERGRFRIPDRGWPSWAHPVVSGGRLYLRNQDVLTAYDIRAR
jgi:outer membrane protein assembly factor BamB